MNDQDAEECYNIEINYNDSITKISKLKEELDYKALKQIIKEALNLEIQTGDYLDIMFIDRLHEDDLIEITCDEELAEILNLLSIFESKTIPLKVNLLQNMNYLSSSGQLFVSEMTESNRTKCLICYKELPKTFYICSICDNFYSCKRCTSKHQLDHPMFYIKEPCPSIFNIKENILTYFDKNKADVSSGKKALKSHKYKVDIKLFGKIQCFAISSKSELVLDLSVQNLGDDIKGEINIIVKNTGDIEVYKDVINDLKKNDGTVVKVRFKVKDDSVKKNYNNVCIGLHHNKYYIKHKEIQVELLVRNEKDVLSNNAEIFFRSQKLLSLLPNAHKEKLYCMIQNKEITSNLQVLDKEFENCNINFEEFMAKFAKKKEESNTKGNDNRN